jgi:hypothetical protein
MTKLTLTFALLLTAAAAAHAQIPNGSPGSDPVREAMRVGDPARTDEARIAASRAANVRSEDEADAVRRAMPQTFNAEIAVTNSAAQAIKAVSWRATLINPETGAVIRSYDVTTEARIAPGSTKKLSKRLRTPRDNVVKAASQPRHKPTVADLKVKVTGVTYVDGSTSTTP